MVVVKIIDTQNCFARKNVITILYKTTSTKKTTTTKNVQRDFRERDCQNVRKTINVHDFRDNDLS